MAKPSELTISTFDTNQLISIISALVLVTEIDRRLVCPCGKAHELTDFQKNRQAALDGFLNSIDRASPGWSAKTLPKIQALARNEIDALQATFRKIDAQKILKEARRESPQNLH
jgi:hypothetical protein